MNCLSSGPGSSTSLRLLRSHTPKDRTRRAVRASPRVQRSSALNLIVRLNPLAQLPCGRPAERVRAWEVATPDPRWPTNPLHAFPLRLLSVLGSCDASTPVARLHAAHFRSWYDTPRPPEPRVLRDRATRRLIALREISRSRADDVITQPLGAHLAPAERASRTARTCARRTRRQRWRRDVVAGFCRPCRAPCCGTKRSR